MGPFSLGDWHEDRVCIYDDSTDTAVAWISEAQGRPLPGTLLMLIKAAPDMLKALYLASAALDFAQAQVDSEKDAVAIRSWRRDIQAAIAKATTEEVPHG